MTTKAIDKLDASYQDLLGKITKTYTSGHQKAVHAVNASMIETYWKIGQYIVDFEQGGSLKAQYGRALLRLLSKDLTFSHGKGFSMSNLYLMRLFFIRYPIFQTVSGKFKHLNWSLCTISILLA